MDHIDEQKVKQQIFSMSDDELKHAATISRNEYVTDVLEIIDIEIKKRNIKIVQNVQNSPETGIDFHASTDRFGGILIIFIIGLFLVLIKSIVNIVQGLGFTDNVSLLIACCFEGALTFVFSAVILSQIFKKEKVVLKTVKIYLVFCTVTILISIFSDPGDIEIRNLIQLCFMVFWFVYFTKSERVKNIFVN